MKIMRCPINGERPMQEFTYGGEFRPMPDPNATSNADWADYVFNLAGEPGIHKEWWYHNASGVWFIAERNNVTDEISATYLYQEMASHE